MIVKIKSKNKCVLSDRWNNTAIVIPDIVSLSNLNIKYENYISNLLLLKVLITQ